MGVFPLRRGGCSNRKTQIPGPGRLDGGNFPMMPRKKRNPFSQVGMSHRNPARMPHGDGQQERCDAGAWRDGDMGGGGVPVGPKEGAGRGCGESGLPMAVGLGAGGVSPGRPHFGHPRSCRRQRHCLAEHCCLLSPLSPPPAWPGTWGQAQGVPRPPLPCCCSAPPTAAPPPYIHRITVPTAPAPS